MPPRLSHWNPWKGVGVLPRGIWVLGATMLVNRMGTMVLPFLLLYLTQSLGFEAGRAALILTCYGFGSIVAAPLAGRLADRVGSLAIMRASLVLTAGVLFVFPRFSSYALVLACAVAFAVVSEAYRPASMALVTELVPTHHRKAAYSVSRLAINLGMSVGPALGGFIAERSFHGLFWVDGGTSLAAAAILFLVPLGAPVRAPSSPIGGASAPAKSTPPPYANGRFVLFLVGCVALSAAFFQHMGAMPLYLVRDLGFTKAFYGALFTLNTVLIVIFEVRLNFLTSHWTHRRSLWLGSILVGAGFGALAFARGAWPVAGTVVVWTVGEMILLPSMSNFVADLAPPERRGEYMGFYTMAWGTAFSFGPALGAVVLDRWGPVACWLGTFGACLLGAGLMSRPEDELPGRAPAGPAREAA